MKDILSRTSLLVSTVLFLIFSSQLAIAGGISLGSTRIIYPVGAKQVSISVRNTSSDAAYLVQSWTENANGQKSADFIVTPPLFVSNSGDENMLRVIFSGPELPSDRETIYYFNTRAVPAVAKSKIENKSILMLSTTTRIKLFVRPLGLAPAVDKAPELLAFDKSGEQLNITNPSPYYITLVDLKIDGKKLDDVMVSPKSNVYVPIPLAKGMALSYRTMNDYGGATPERKVILK